VVTLFEGARRSVEQLYGVRPERVSVIPNARDAEALRPVGPAERAGARSDLGVDDDRPVVAVVGSLSPEKRTTLAIETIEAVERIGTDRGSGRPALLVAGDGPLRAEVDARAAASPADVRLLGNRPDLRPVYAAADLVLSTSSTEGMPGVLIEAALCGVPAVATDVGASAEVVGPGGLVVAPTATASEIADAVWRVLADRASYGRAAAEHSRGNFTWEHVVPKWSTLLERVAP
jgi:glycosyltransferase involved in cell wall biosynthesis